MKAANRRVRDDQGVVLPTRLLALSISAVAMAALVLVANDPDEAPVEATPAVTKPSASPSETRDRADTPSATPKPKPKPEPVKRGETYVVVYNNTSIKGLAGGVAEKAKGAGWNVVGSDNWYGTVDGTAVYYPPRFKRAAEELGFDLGIKRIKPSQEPMQFDRLTVILTEDFQG